MESYFVSTYHESVSNVKFDSTYIAITESEYLWVINTKGWKAI